MSIVTTQILNLPIPPSDQDSSPTYSIRGQTNTARLGAVIPIHYGRHVLWPDLIMTPFREYVDEDEWYCLLGCVGVGKISAEQWRFGELYLESLPPSDCVYQIYYPGESPALMPATVYTAVHNSLDLTTVQSLGTIVNPAGTQVTQLAVDLALAGLGYNNDDGTISSRSVTIMLETRPLDATGLPTAPWVLSASLTITAAQKEPVRRTLKVTVPPARYEVRIYVAAPPSADSKQMDKVIWSAARGYDFAHPVYGNVTLCALKVKATALTTTDDSQQLSLIGTRWIRHWTGSSWVEQASRSIVWALTDAYINIAGLPVETLSLTNLLSMHNRLESLGHQFDYRFEQSVSLLSALQTIARAGRCQLVQVNGMWQLVRDQAIAVSEVKALFTPDNLAGFSMGYRVAGYADPDAIVAEYVNPNTGRLHALQYPSSIVAARPDNIKLAGICEREHAWDEAVYLWRAAQRRRYGEFTTGLEGNALLPQDVVIVAADGMDWGSWGYIVAQSDVYTTLSQQLHFATGTLFIRNPDGRLHSSHVITVLEDKVTITGVPTLTPPLHHEELLFYIAYPADKTPVHCRITSVDPQSNDYVRIAFLVDDISVYAPLPSMPISATASVEPASLEIPWSKAAGIAISTGYDLRISWGRVAAAVGGYVVDIQRSGETGWRRIYTGTEALCSSTIASGQYNYRIAALGARQGAWRTGSLEVGIGAALLPAPTPMLASAFTGNALEVKWVAIPNAARYRVAVYRSAGLTLCRIVDVSAPNFRYTWEAGRDDSAGRALTVRVWALDIVGNLSTGYGEVSAANPQVTALTGVSGAVSGGIAELTFIKPTDSDYAGILIYVSSTNGFAPSSLNLFYEGNADSIRVPVTPGTTKYLKITGYDVWGRDNTVIVSQYTLTAEGLGGSNIADNAITSDKIQTGAITADKVAAGSITAEKISTGSITSDKIQTGAITADKVAAGAITANKIAVTTLAAITGSIGTLTTGRLYNTAQTALLDLDAINAQAFISLKDAAGNVAFRVRANGDSYFKGTVECNQLIASSAIIGTALIQDGAVSSAAGGEYAATRSIGNATTALQSISVTGKGTGVAMAFVKCSGTQFPGSASAGSSDSGYYQLPITIAVDLLVDGAVVESAMFTATGTSTTPTPTHAGAWSVSFFADLTAWSGSKTLTLQSRRAGSESISVSGNVTKSSIRVLQWGK